MDLTRSRLQEGIRCPHDLLKGSERRWEEPSDCNAGRILKEKRKGGKLIRKALGLQLGSKEGSSRWMGKSSSQGCPLEESPISPEWACHWHPGCARSLAGGSLQEVWRQCSEDAQVQWLEPSAGYSPCCRRSKGHILWLLHQLHDIR